MMSRFGVGSALAFAACIIVMMISQGNASAFVFGASSAAWQYEGGLDADGRGPTIWEDFCGGLNPSGNPRCRNRGADAKKACDQYNLATLGEDITRLKDLGMKAYRLSIAWSRIIPQGTGNVNERGIAHYRRVFEMLRAAQIDPYVTLFHFDLPSSLERNGGWLNISTSDAFQRYARVCFEAFGDIVKHWITLNE